MGFLMNQREFAEHIGVSQPRVSKMIEDGIIKRAIKKTSAKRFKIDSEIGVVEVEANLDPSRKTKANVNSDKKINTIFSAGLDMEGLDYQKSRALNEHYKAALNKIEYEKAEGLLIEKEKAEKYFFDCARTVRDSVLNIPNRVADQLSVMKDRNEIEKLLKKELTNSLESISNGLFRGF